MYANIISKEVRSSGECISLNIDHSNFSKNSPRITSKESTLDGSVIVTDWGFNEGNRVIIISNISLDTDIYDKLVGMKEDNDSTFYFTYINDIWRVIIQEVSGKWKGLGYETRISLTIVEKLEGSYE